ncbi:MAG: electron transfer flavoprotein subunit beta/FixA family protein [Deltaproteobacteria bacterium]|nr:electron transfer flavoprotein subunit beta/FixA family protein [Deltaproteobacteria bacterium]
MNIIVLVKQVPDTSKIQIDPRTGTLKREGAPGIINPEDTHALETALQLKEIRGGSITVVSMGPPQAIDAISEALGMGADRGILLTDPFFAGADTWATSTVLGKTVQRLQPFDLILCGRQAIDGDTAQIGPQVAEFLNLPQVTYVRHMETKDASIICERTVDGGIETAISPLPCLATVLASKNRPRYPVIRNLLSACREKAPIEVWNAADIGLKVDDIGLLGSLTKVVRVFSPKQERMGEIWQDSADVMATRLVDRLSAAHLL